jgi:hypothetical protein
MVIIPGIEVDEGRLAAICSKYGIAERQGDLSALSPLTKGPAFWVPTHFTSTLVT